MAKSGDKTGKSSKSNKTARVMNLLAGAVSDAPETPEAAAPQAQEAPRPAPAAPAFTPLQREADEEVAEKIRGALSEELGGQAEAPGQEAPAVQSPEPQAEVPEPAQEASPEPAAAPEAPPQPERVPAPPSGISYINVMQALVEAKVDKYIQLFGLCTCPRCRIDVLALALTNLPAKYAVVKEQELVPLLSVYEGRYNAAIVAQVMSACKIVMEHPRHDL